MEILITFGINFLSQLLKKYVAPRWGEDGVQLTVLILSAVASGIYITYFNVEGFQNFIVALGAFFMTAITFYETIFKKLNWDTTKQLKNEVSN